MLKRITLSGFRTFLTEQTIELPQVPGLFLMRGINEVDNALDGNDVGKSTLWDAVYWGLYGETTRGLRAGQVISWGGDSAIVEQEWETDEGTVIVRRQQNPNGLCIDNNTAEQGDIDVAINLDKQEFLHSVLVGQFTPYFLDLSPTAKLEMLGGVLGLGYWEDKSVEANKNATEYEVKANTVLGQLQRTKGKLEALRQQRAEVQQNSDNWQERYNRYCVEAKQELAKLQRTEFGAEKTLEERQAELKVADDKVSKRTRNWQQFIDELSKLSTDIESFRRDMRLDQCPFCKRPLADKWRDKLQQQLDELITRQEQASEGFQACKDSIAKAKAQRDAVCELVKAASSKLYELRGLIKAKKTDSVEDENPYIATLSSLKSEILSTIAERKSLETEHSELVTTQQRWRYWVKGFRDLRLWVLDSTLAELEIRVNNSLVQLGLMNWTMHMAVERENKSGGVTKGFLVNVQSSDSVDVAPWRGWGGGVTQRLRVAAEIGLARLISDRKAVDLGVEVWDEPDCHMSKSGVEDLLIHLQARAKEEQRQIWVVTHRNLDHNFDGTATVRKTRAGSFVELG